MLLYIIRHGETRLNALGCLQGWIDEPLIDNGRLLATITGQALHDVPFDLCISSDLSRALETAELVLKENDRKDIPIILDKRLREHEWGSFDGLVCTKKGYGLPIPPEEFAPYFKEGISDMLPPDVEGIPRMTIRAKGFWDDITNREEYKDKTILISTHGAFTRALMRNVYPKDEPYWHTGIPDNCCVNIVRVEDGKTEQLGDDLVFYDRSLCVNAYNS